MPANPDIQADRRAAIVRILTENAVTTQSALVRALQELGHDATQSSVSRDFRVLGVQKTPDGYRLPVSQASEEQEELIEAARYVRQIQTAGPNLVVIRTAIGAAQRVALAIDRANWPEIVGTVSGDDTIFIATASQADSRNIVRRVDYLGSGQ